MLVARSTRATKRLRLSSETLKTARDWTLKSARSLPNATKTAILDQVRRLHSLSRCVGRLSGAPGWVYGSLAVRS